MQYMPGALEYEPRPPRTFTIMSWNVNGMKNIVREGFSGWLKKNSPDILCLQETHLGRKDVSVDLQTPWPYRSYWDFEPTNFSGVVTYTKQMPRNVWYDVGTKWFDEEGKMMVLEFDNFTVVNVRMPHGGKALGTLEEKMRACREFLDYAHYLRRKHVPTIICGTLNISHENMDLFHPKMYDAFPTFTEEERQCFEKIFDMGYIDTFRVFNQNDLLYSSWADLNCRDMNIGQRIDYVLISEDLIRTVKNSFVMQHIHGSDHCPVGIKIQM